MNKSESKYFNTAAKMDEALITLLEKKDFEYITVKEICQQAGVNRSTFYLHYENTRDLLEESSRYLIERFLSYFSVQYQNLPQTFPNYQLKNPVFITEEYLLPYLQFFRDNKKLLKTVLKHSGTFSFDEIYQRMFQHIFTPILTYFGYPEKEQDYVMHFYLNGIQSIIAQWLKNDCQQENEFICAVIKNCIFGRDQG